ncbi:MAG: hypothetical protein SWQ30_19990 [Thermodesulfobacteriota bacterium]|nr:hypothetical protein [Thermodesulfobacteriota bacterium]
MVDNKKPDYWARALAGISIIGIIANCIFDYHTTFRKKPDLVYSQRWDISDTTVMKWSLSDIARGHLFGEFPGDRRVPVNFLVHSIELRNKGGKETGRISIKLKNVEGLEVTTNWLVQSPRLEWEPSTHEKPFFEEETKMLEISNVSPNNDSIKLYVFIRLDKETEIRKADIPYVEEVKFSDGFGSLIGEPFEDGSKERLRTRLQDQLSTLLKEQSE